MDSLGIDVGASDSDNMRTFKRVTVSTEVFTYEEVVVWFRMLSGLVKLLVGRQRTLKRLWTRWQLMLYRAMYTRHKR